MSIAPEECFVQWSNLPHFVMDADTGGRAAEPYSRKAWLDYERLQKYMTGHVHPGYRSHQTRSTTNKEMYVFLIC